MPPIKIEPDLVDDGRHGFMPGVGRVRTGPRTNGYWESRERNGSSFDDNGHFYDSYRPSYQDSPSTPFSDRRLGGTSFPPSWEREREERRQEQRQREQHLANAGQQAGRQGTIKQESALQNPSEEEQHTEDLRHDSSTLTGSNDTITSNRCLCNTLPISVGQTSCIIPNV